MIPLRTILHPTDLSESSRAAFHVARSLADRHCARLVILHVDAENPRRPLSSASECDEFECNLIDQLRTHHLVNADTPVEYQVVHGSPVEMILDTAQKIHADMIVMGTHGRSGIHRLVMGSVAETINRSSLCPVVTVRGKFASELSPEISEAESETGPVLNL